MNSVRSAARGAAGPDRAHASPRSRPAQDDQHVDHAHEPGKVRGVPCINCNSALGKLRDDPGAHRRAIAYPEGNVWKPILEAPGVYQLPS
ncbi:endonuclease domain-containing protein [Streptomyces sp. NPDC048196]|uniref:endonuclease domain-containing protein n=1 Tax=Streptomyces sp. NPDC048196 TaxID=3154712 RepID=UPI00340462C0